MTQEQEPDVPSPDPVPPTVTPSMRTELRLAESASDRILTIVAWVAGLVLIIVLAALVATFVWWVQHTRFELSPVAYEAEERLEVIPVPEVPVTISEDGVQIRNASWLVSPRPEYPRRAQVRGVESGLVELECLTLVNGLIGSCEVVRETPAGVGFADAAIAAARKSRVRPREVDGVATESIISFKATFRVE